MAGNFFPKLLVPVLCLFISAPLWARTHTAEEKAALTLYKQGLSLERQGRFKDALDLVQKAFLILPNEYVTFNLSFIYFKLGDCQSMGDYLSRLDMTKLPVQARTKAKAMQFHCQLKALANVTGVQGVIKLAAIMDKAPDDAARKEVRDLAASLVKNPGIKAEMVKMAGAGQDLAPLWKAIDKVQGQDSTMSMRRTIMLAILANSFAARDSQPAKNALLELARLRMDAGNVRTTCAWDQSTIKAIAACRAYTMGRQAFDSHGYKGALFAFGLANTLYPRPEMRVYKGVSLLYLNNPARAAQMLEPVQDQAVSMGFGRVADAIHLGLREPVQVLRAARILALCKAGKPGCADQLNPLVDAGVLDACKVAKYLSGLPGATGFQAQCQPPAPKPVAATAPEPAATPAPFPARVLMSRPASHNSVRTAAWTVAGVSAALLGTGAILLGVANSKLKDLAAASDYKYSQKDFISNVDSAHSLRTWGWVTAGIGAASAITSIVLFIIKPKSPVHVSAIAAPHMAGISVFTRF